MDPCEALRENHRREMERLEKQQIEDARRRAQDLREIEIIVEETVRIYTERSDQECV